LKKIFFLSFCILSGQDTYQGQVLFDYSGTENGTFSSMVQDSVISGFALNQNNQDTSYFLIASITQQSDNEFDLFLAALQDTSFPLQPRTWSIPGEGDEDDPFSLETILVFMPGLDSSFVTELFNAFTDTSTFEDSTDIFSDFFDTFADDLYLGLQGELEISNVTDSSITGTFNTIMIKPAFHFPPHTIFIEDGEFNFYDIAVADLEISEEREIPEKHDLHSIHPNPFNSNTTIQLFVNSPLQNMSLHVVDIGGRKVETIFIGQLNSGSHSFNWNSKQNPSGIYFSVLNTGNSIKTRKMILVK